MPDLSFDDLLEDLEKDRPSFSVELLTPEMIKMLMAGREIKPEISYPCLSEKLRKLLHNPNIQNRAIESAYRTNRTKWLKTYADWLKKYKDERK